MMEARSRKMQTYRQAFIFTMENGAVVLAVAFGEDAQHGEGLAHNMATDLEQCHVWDSYAFPTHPELPEGARRLFLA